MIDVGAEQGSVVDAMLLAGLEHVHAFEPSSVNADTMRMRFAGDARVAVHEHAVSDGDGDAQLHVSSHPDGTPLPFGHTLLKRVNTDEIAWNDTVTVSRRSLGSLVGENEIPRRVGILKIDTEGHDLAVLRGMGPLEADVVMVEHWSDLPHGLGKCPWTAAQLLAELEPRGFVHFAFVVHRGEFVTIKWDDAEVERGVVGNLIFMHDSVLVRLLPDVLDIAGNLAEEAVRIGQRYMRAAAERLVVLNELKEAADSRLQALEATTAKVRSQAAQLESLRRAVG
jgi:FkbM family methyltransferase